jgi:aspartate/methionine/tyrosine aminotransferase
MQESSVLHLADRLRDIPPFHVMELLTRAQELESQGRDIIHMEVGEPDFPTPPLVLRAAQDFLAQGQVRYTPALGLPALRSAISHFYANHFQSHVPASRILITSGASGALLLAIAALTNPNDEWLLTDPGYPCNHQFIQAFNGRVRAMPVEADTNFQPTPTQIAAAWDKQTRGVLLASPSNPTGTLIATEALSEIGDFVNSRKGFLIVDEIYQGLVYEQAAHSVLSTRNDVFVVNSFSKYFGMTGWRLGWLVVPEGYTRPLERLAQHLFIAPSTPAQYAALAAFSPANLAELEARRHVFSRRREVLLQGLAELGIPVQAEPKGAFYAYAYVGKLCSDSMQLAHRLLEDAGVATTPGLDFGSHHANEHLRIAYTADESRILEALQRMRSVVR